MGPADMLQEFGTASSNKWDSGLQREMQSAFAGEAHHATATSKVQQIADTDLPTLTKAELAELVFEHVGLNKREAKDMVDAFFPEINDALVRGESVKLAGFGNFQLRDKGSRPGRNPKTGEVVTIAPRRVVTFQPSQKLTVVPDYTTAMRSVD